ncbi:hypothetical protein Syun_005175 [Stephania yunnanensis]|uniref:Uncharacterized protein n=1 Tax=Stephania yunnanensis TaxID=152371 RepID=A0AAP0Q1Z7_9MAGN
MAMGKARNPKRSSSSGSYVSTVTMLAFVALCALGLWILTSSSVVPPPHTAAATARTSSSNSDPNSRFPYSKPIQRHAFDDSQGELPDDAIKGDAEQREEPKKQLLVEGRTDPDEEPIREDPEQVADRDSGADLGENPTQILQTYPNQTQQESDTTQSGEISLPKQQVSEIEGHENQEQNQTQIQQVTSEDARKEQQQREYQEAEIGEDQQYQQTPIENSPGETKESNQTETIITTSDSNNKEDIQQVTSTEAAEEESNDENSGGLFPAHSGIRKESNESKAAWATQAAQSMNQKGRSNDGGGDTSKEFVWELCNVTAGADYIPCLDNDEAIRHLQSRKHFEHRERHCPREGPTCLVPVPKGYKRSIEWPKSRDKIWHANVPHTKLAEVKGHQNWMKVTGEFLTFPGGGTQFIHGALHYIDFIQKSIPKINWGKHTRVVLDVGCGVASFGGYLFERDVLTMSFAPKDEHEAQVQFALERGIPAISAVMGSQRLPFPSRVFDLVHCARCRVPWHVEGGALLLELNRVLRPGGYFVWSATPVYQKLPEDTEIWKAMSSLTRSMCWDLVTIRKDKLNGIGAAIYRKPVSNECYEQRRRNSPPMCKDGDDANAAWYVPLQACMHRVPTHSVERGSQWPENWPLRVHKPPYWLNNSQKGIYGKPAPEDFVTDYEHWKTVVTKSYMSGLGISWSNVRNVMDMRAVYGGFAAALKDLKVWVMNVVNIDSPDTLPIIYERGLFGIYHDWCESFSTYPRTYDLLHADHLFSRLKKRCNLLAVMAEVDRIVRPGGKLIVRDEPSVIGEVENILTSLHWEIHLTFTKDQDGVLSAQKTDWRPQLYSSLS